MSVNLDFLQFSAEHCPEHHTAFASLLIFHGASWCPISPREATNLVMLGAFDSYVAPYTASCNANTFLSYQALTFFHTVALLQDWKHLVSH